jgi:hypothetical protein
VESYLDRTLISMCRAGLPDDLQDIPVAVHTCARPLSACRHGSGRAADHHRLPVQMSACLGVALPASYRRHDKTWSYIALMPWGCILRPGSDVTSCTLLMMYIYSSKKGMCILRQPLLCSDTTK